MIELTEVTKSYAGRVVLQIPHLMFESGKRYAIIGVNGCGKTTLLRILAGTLLPDAGSVSGVPLHTLGYMPQSPYAFGFSVLRNVQIALPKSSHAEACALKALTDVGIHDLRHARGSRLPGGETQRMALARLIAQPRDLLLLDEPTSSADIRGTDQIEKALLQYAADAACTVILSTHSPAQALRLAQEVLYLDQGRVVEQGSAQELLKNPRHENTRLFLQHWKL